VGGAAARGRGGRRRALQRGGTAVAAAAGAAMHGWRAGSGAQMAWHGQPLVARAMRLRGCSSSLSAPGSQWCSCSACASRATRGMTDEVGRAAAQHGHQEVLQWARQQGCPWDAWTCSDAAKGGQLEVLQWARQQGCPWNDEACRAAARGGHQEVLTEVAAPAGLPMGRVDLYRGSRKPPRSAAVGTPAGLPLGSGDVFKGSRRRPPRSLPLGGWRTGAPMTSVSALPWRSRITSLTFERYSGA
jgi:hypothetical protein